MGHALDGRVLDPKQRQPALRAVLAASMVSTVGVLPVFLLGAVAVLIRNDLRFTEVQLGVAVSVYWVAASVCSIPSGRVVERLGAYGALALGAAGGGTTLLGIAAAGSWMAILPWMIVGGIANAFSQLAANLRLADAVPRTRQGLAFGIKQSAIPAATLIGGTAVPAIALPFGWRWVFAVAAGVAVVAGLSQSRGVRNAPFVPSRRKPQVTLARAPLILLALAAAFGAAAATAMATFVIGYAVAVGIRPGPAGAILGIGSLAAIAARVTVGWLADRRDGGNLMVVAGMLAVGGAAVSVFPLVSSWSAILTVATVAYAVGWGWPGLFNFTVVRGNPEAPAAATGVTQTGVYLGGVGGPPTFGFLVTHLGYLAAWRSAAMSLLAAAILMLMGRRLARRAWLPLASTGGSRGSRAVPSGMFGDSDP